MAYQLFRAVYHAYAADPVPSRSETGRFHQESKPTTCLAATPRTAWMEVSHRWNAESASFRMATIEASVTNLIDLTDSSVQAAFGITEGQLVDVNCEDCRQLAELLRGRGIEAVWTYSAADRPGGRQLVIFLDQLSASSNIRVLSIDPVFGV